MTAPGPTTSYVLDAEDHIIDVCSNWDAFAQANGAQGLTHGRVLGRRLQEFVTGPDTRMFVELMLKSARLSQEPVIRPYRCDSPELRRQMEMTMTSLGGGVLRLDHRLLSTAANKVPVRVAGQTRLAPRLVKRCSMCNRLRADDGQWVEGDDHPASLLPPAVAVFYGICGSCRPVMQRAI